MLCQELVTTFGICLGTLKRWLANRRRGLEEHATFAGLLAREHAFIQTLCTGFSTLIAGVTRTRRLATA